MSNRDPNCLHCGSPRILPFPIITGQRELGGSWKSIILCEKCLEEQGKILSDLMYSSPESPPNTSFKFYIKTWDKLLDSSIFRNQREVNARLHFNQMWNRFGLINWVLSPRVIKIGERKDFALGLKGFLHPFTKEIGLLGFFDYGEHRTAWDLNRQYDEGTKLEELIYGVTFDKIKEFLSPLLVQMQDKISSANPPVWFSGPYKFLTWDLKKNKGKTGIVPNYQLLVKRYQSFRHLYSWTAYCQIEGEKDHKTHSIALEGLCHPKQGLIRLMRFFGNQASLPIAESLNQMYFAGQSLNALISGIPIQDQFGKILDMAQEWQLHNWQ